MTAARRLADLTPAQRRVILALRDHVRDAVPVPAAAPPKKASPIAA